MRGFPRDPYHGNRPLSARADMASTHPASWVALRAIAIAVLAACAVFSGYLAVQAVHDDGLFELEGNIADAPGGAPDWGSMFDANGQPVGDDVLRWQYRSWSLHRYISDWSNDNNLEKFEIGNGKVVLQTKGTL